MIVLAALGLFALAELAFRLLGGPRLGTQPRALVAVAAAGGTVAMLATVAAAATTPGRGAGAAGLLAATLLLAGLRRSARQATREGAERGAAEDV